MTKDIEREAFEEWYENHKPVLLVENIVKGTARAAWQAAKAHEAEKLKGKVVVPVEPTNEMLFAASGRDIVAEHYGDENIMWPELRETWKAMLEAARGGK